MLETCALEASPPLSSLTHYIQISNELFIHRTHTSKEDVIYMHLP